ncbi:unnamed protein product, partial [Iphiclides podalirius]
MRRFELSTDYRLPQIAAPVALSSVGSEQLREIEPNEESTHRPPRQDRYPNVRNRHVEINPRTLSERSALSHGADSGASRKKPDSRTNGSVPLSVKVAKESSS